MSDHILQMIDEIQSIQNKASVQALASAPLARPLPSSSMFGNSDELRATMKKIRAIEASHPTLAKFPEPRIIQGNPFCNKTDLQKAQKHLAKISASSPATASAPRIRPILSKPSTAPTAPTGRTASAFLAMASTERNKLIHSAMAKASRPLRDELRAAFKSAPASQRVEFAAAFRNALHAHEQQDAPSIPATEFAALTPTEKMNTVRAGIRIS